MQIFISCLKTELKRFFRIRNIVITVMILIVSMGFIQSGISDYRNMLALENEFQNMEKLRVTQFVNYRQYATYGIRMLFLPSPFSIFFTNTGVAPDVTAFIDSGERLKIDNPMIGKSIFSIKKFGFTDFSGLLIFFGTLMSLFYGYECFFYKEYIRTIASISRAKPVYFSLLMSRILMIFFYLVLLTGSALFTMKLNGLALPARAPILNFMASSLLTMIFFFLLGTALGTIKSRFSGIPALLSCWFILLFIIPAAVNNYTENQSNIIKPLYKLEMEKLKIIMGYEKQMLQKTKALRINDKPTDIDRKLILSYWNNEFRKIQDMDRDMLDQMRGILSRYQWLSALFPTTNHLSVTTEISSRGYESLLDFYQHVQGLKKKFVQAYLDRVYFSNYTKVDPFFKGNENIYLSRSRLPKPFTQGLLMTTFYIMLLTGFTYYQYKGILYRAHTKMTDNRKHPDLRLTKGQYRIFSIESNFFLNQLYNLFTGYTGKKKILFQKKRGEQEGNFPHIYIDDRDIGVSKFKNSFVYLCSPDSLPGNITAGDFFTFMASICRCPLAEKTKIAQRLNIAAIKRRNLGHLKKQEKAEFLLSITYMCDAEVYLIYDIARGMTRIFTVHFKDRMHGLSEAGKLVLYLTSDTIISEKILEDNTGFIESTSNWIGMVESVRY